MTSFLSPSAPPLSRCSPPTEAPCVAPPAPTPSVKKETVSEKSDSMSQVAPAVTTQPDTTQPVTTQPVTTQPDTTQPVTTQPDTTQPVTTQPVTTQPDTGPVDQVSEVVAEIEPTGCAAVKRFMLQIPYVAECLDSCRTLLHDHNLDLPNLSLPPMPSLPPFPTLPPLPPLPTLPSLPPLPEEIPNITEALSRVSNLAQRCFCSIANRFRGLNSISQTPPQQP
ncbi:unnamed protein product [Arctogadus glacialis]